MRKHLLIAAAMLAALFAGCSSSDGGNLSTDDASQYISTNRPVFYGSSDLDAAHNAVVLIAANNSGFCTGTLISDTYVLTAAHCLADLSSSEKSSLVIGVGKDESTALKNTYSVAQYWYHENYNSYKTTNDVGLLKLASPVPESVAKRILPLPPELAVTQADLDKGVKTVFSGYGYNEKWVYGTKLKLELPVSHYCGGFNAPADSTSGCYISELRSSIPYGSIYYVQDDGGPCSGDSGGPAFITIDGVEYVWGITSYGDRYCTQYGVSTAVPDFYGWIVSKAPEFVASLQPVEEDPVIDEPIIDDPVIDDPIIDDPVIDEPISSLEVGAVCDLNYVESCSGNTGYYCSEGAVTSFQCSDSAPCKVREYDHYSDCAEACNPGDGTSIVCLSYYGWDIAAAYECAATTDGDAGKFLVWSQWCSEGCVNGVGCK